MFRMRSMAMMMISLSLIFLLTGCLEGRTLMIDSPSNVFQTVINNITGNVTFINVTVNDTHVKGDGVYLYNDSTTMNFNETKLNDTIDLRNADTTIGNCSITNSCLNITYDTELTYTNDTHVGGDGIYLYNDSTTMTFNESKLNNTIDIIVGGLAFSFMSTNYNASSATGSDGSVNRTLSVNGTPTFISVDNSHLHPFIDYNYSTPNITFYNRLWDEQIISVWVEVNDVNITVTNYFGSNFSGVDGSADRMLVTDEPQIVVVDNSFLHPLIDYSYASGNLTLSNFLWDEQIISVWI